MSNAVRKQPMPQLQNHRLHFPTDLNLYRAMLRMAERGYATVCRLSDRLSVCNVEVCFLHTGWNTSKIILRPDSLGLLLGLSE